MIDRRVLVAMALMGGVAACHRSGSTVDLGPPVTRPFQVGGFDRLVSAGPYDITIVTDGKPGVTAVGPAKLLDQVEVKVDDGTLAIKPRNRLGPGWLWGGYRDHGRALFTVHSNPLREVTMAGSGDLKLDRASGDFEAVMAGSGDIDIAAVATTSIKLTIAGSGNVAAAGHTRSGDYSIAGSGDMKLAGLAADTIQASIAGSGDIHAHARTRAAISILGSGDVDVVGGARCTITRTGSGTATCH